jgi:hypothetical protein
MPAADMPSSRLPFRNPVLDAHLGGGLLPGSLCVIAGATGAGKTQLALQWAQVGAAFEGCPGVILDLSARGDDQRHETYARDKFGWKLERENLDAPAGDLDELWTRHSGHLAQPLRRAVARHVSREEVDASTWDSWQSDRSRLAQRTALFLYGHLVRGVRRFVIDGVEPTRTPAESIQYAYFEDFDHRVLQQEHDWAAREALRENFRRYELDVAAHPYRPGAVARVFVATLSETLLDDLIAKPIPPGDLFADASTIIYLGRTQEDGRVGRSLHVAKHRGSACGDSILPFRMSDRGLIFE